MTNGRPETDLLPHRPDVRARYEKPPFLTHDQYIQRQILAVGKNSTLPVGSRTIPYCVYGFCPPEEDDEFPWRIILRKAWPHR